MNKSANHEPGNHPSAAQLVAFGQGRLATASHGEVEQHIAECATCCQVLATVPDDALARALRGGGAGLAETQLMDPTTNVVPPADTRLPKELIDHPRYRIVRPLGQGGMGVVYQAEHRLMDRTVALKVINRRLTSSPTAVERFRLEVKAAARLAHPTIVTAHDAEQAGDLHFLVMEFVDGVSLARQVEKRGPLSVMHACNFARQVALGLQHAFERGMVHRDIKPQNLMINKKGQVKILDFGLARLARNSADPATVDSHGSGGGGGLTMDGVVLGTPDFIAPEQVSDSRAVDIRADIYSLGCTLYFLLTGRVPFPQGDAAAKARAHLTQSPAPIETLRAGLPPEVVAIIERMMAKDPSARYQTPGEVAAALQPFSKPTSASASATEGAASRVAPSTMAPAGESAQPAASPSLPADQLAPLPLDALWSAWPTFDAQAGSTLPSALAAMPSVGGAYHAGPFAARRAQGFDLRRWLRANRKWLAPAAALAAAIVVVWLGVSALSGRSDTNEDVLVIAANNEGHDFKLQLPDAPSHFPEVDTGKRGFGKISLGGASKNRVLLVIAHQGFWYDDFEPVRRVLTEGGAMVTVASSAAGTARPDPGSRKAGRPEPVEPDVVLHEARAEDYDAVVFTGGGMDKFIPGGVAAEATKTLVDRMQADGKLVTSICGGNLVLAHTGALRGHRAAINPFIPENLKSEGVAHWTWQEQVIVDENIITARNFADAEQFAEKLLEKLSAE